MSEPATYFSDIIANELCYAYGLYPDEGAKYEPWKYANDEWIFQIAGFGPTARCLIKIDATQINP